MYHNEEMGCHSKGLLVQCRCLVTTKFQHITAILQVSLDTENASCMH